MNGHEHGCSKSGAPAPPPVFALVSILHGGERHALAPGVTDAPALCGVEDMGAAWGGWFVQGYTRRPSSMSW